MVTPIFSTEITTQLFDPIKLPPKPFDHVRSIKHRIIYVLVMLTFLYKRLYVCLCLCYVQEIAMTGIKIHVWSVLTQNNKKVVLRRTVKTIVHDVIE